MTEWCARAGLAETFGRPLSRIPRPSDAAQQGLATRLGAHGVHAGVDAQVDQPVRRLLGGLFEIFDGAILLAEAQVDSGEEVRRDVFLLREFQQIVEDRVCLWPLAGE